MASRIQFTEEIVPNGGIDESRSPTKIASHAWSGADNVEPMPEGVRSRPGSEHVNSSPILAVDQSYEGGTDDRQMVDGTAEFVSQGFQLTNAIDATEAMWVAVRMKKVNSPTGNVDLAIYDNNGGEPGSVVTGNGFGSFNSIDSADLTDSYQWYVYQDSGLFTGLSASTTYHLVLRHAGADGTNEVAIEFASAAGTYANGSSYYSTDLVTWVQGNAADDLNFRIYGAKATATITAIADYKLSDGSAERHLIVADGEVYKQDSGTMTLVSGRERLALTAANTIYPSWAVGQDRWFMTNDTDISKKFYVLSGTEYWSNEGVEAPTSNLSLSATSGGTLAVGTWEVDYRFVNVIAGADFTIEQFSDSRYGGVNGDPVTTDSSNKTITISDIPTVPERENDEVTHIQFELKLQGTDTVFRRYKRITLGTASTTITGSETPTTAATYDHAIPPVHKVKAVAENRQFIGNIIGFPYRVHWSKIDGATPYYESYPATNFRDFGAGEGDEVTALAYVPPRSLVVGFRNSIWAIDARIPATSDRYLISRNVGIANHNAWIVVNQRLFFVSNADGHKGMYVWSGRGIPEVQSKIQSTFQGLNATRLDKVSCAPLTPDSNRFQWWTLCSSSGSNVHDTILVYDWVLDAWSVYTRDSSIPLNVLGVVESDGNRFVYGGDTSGIEWKADSSFTDDEGTAFTGEVTLKNFDFGAPGMFKKMRFIDYGAEEQSSGTIAANVMTDTGNTTASLPHLAAGSVFTLGTSELGGTDVLGGSGDITAGRVAVHGNVSSRRFKPSFSSSDKWFLKSVSFGMQPQGRR